MKNKLLEHLEKLNYFAVVAESASFYKASLRLGLSQPALTRSIQSLEFILDQQLFIRSSRGVKLTNYGAELLKLSQEITQKVEEWQTPTNGPAKSSALENLSLGTYENLANGLVPLFLKSLTKKIEIQKYKVWTGSTNSQLHGMLLEKKLDYLLLAEPQKYRGVAYKPLITETYGFFASRELYKKLPLKNSELSLAELKKLKLLTIPNAIAGANKNVDRILWETDLKNVVDFNSFAVIRSFLLNDFGIGLLPSLSVLADVKEGKILPLAIQGIASKNLAPHRMFLCTRSNENEEALSSLTVSFQKFLATFK